MFIDLYIFLQIIGESFPISSSGHLYFLKKFSSFWLHDVQRLVISRTFDYLLHLSTVCIVFIYFYHYFRSYIYLLIKGSYKALHLVFAVFVTTCITLCFYLFYQYTLISIPLYLGFFITASCLYMLQFISKRPEKTIDELTYKDILIIAIAQGITLLPGISRFGITYVVTRWRGLNAMDAYFYSFALAIALFIPASTYALFKVMGDLSIITNLISLKEYVAVSLMACVLSYYSFIIVGNLIRTNQLWYISYYMYALSFSAAIIVWLF